MSEAKALIERYRIIRERLRRPPNAVPDTGINLRRAKEPPVQEVIPPEPPFQLPELAPVIPFRRIDLTFSSTLEFAAKEFNITSKDIRMRCRKSYISLPRQIAIYLAAKNKVQSLAGMARYLHMDHTTMIHANQKVKFLVQTDATMRDRIESLEERLLANFNRTPVSTLDESHLESQENGGSLSVTAISAVDN